MQLCTMSLQRSAALAVTLMFAAACGGSGSDTNDPDGGGTDAMNNPPNPIGLGPAPVDLGSITGRSPAA